MDDTVSPYFKSAVCDPVKMGGDNDVQMNPGNKSQLIDNVDTSGSSQGNQPSSSQSSLSAQRLDKNFYEQECITLAKALLGQVLVRIVDGKRVTGRVVETESYLGGVDVASHSYNGKRTPRTEPMYMDPGTIYVYKIYGMYHCLNISSKEEGSCVLIRSLEPIDGVDYMIDVRQENRKNSKALKPHELCSGPSKLCQALHITKELCNKEDACISEKIWLEKGPSVPKEETVISKRIGIDSVGPEWANKPLRFYVFNNKNVSVRDKKAEAKLFPT